MSDGKIVFEKNKVFNADCFDLIAVMPDESLDLVIVDPPYGDVSERFCSADEYVKYMDNQGYTFKDDYDISQPINTYPSDFRREYFRREWYRIKTMKKLIKRIEVLEGILNAR